MFKYSLVLLFALSVAVAPLSFRGVTLSHEGEESLNHLGENSELVFTSLIAGEETGEEIVRKSRVLADDTHTRELVSSAEESNSSSSSDEDDSVCSDSSESSEEENNSVLIAGETEEERIRRLIDESESSDDNGETGNLVLANEEETQTASNTVLVSEEEEIRQVAQDVASLEIAFFRDLTNQAGWNQETRRVEVEPVVQVDERELGQNSTEGLEGIQELFAEMF